MVLNSFVFYIFFEMLCTKVNIWCVISDIISKMIYFFNVFKFLLVYMYVLFIWWNIFNDNIMLTVFNGFKVLKFIVLIDIWYIMF